MTFDDQNLDIMNPNIDFFFEQLIEHEISQ